MSHKTLTIHLCAHAQTHKQRPIHDGISSVESVVIKMYPIKTRFNESNALNIRYR